MKAIKGCTILVLPFIMYFVVLTLKYIVLCDTTCAVGKL